MSPDALRAETLLSILNAHVHDFLFSIGIGPFESQFGARSAPLHVRRWQLADQRSPFEHTYCYFVMNKVLSARC